MPLVLLRYQHRAHCCECVSQTSRRTLLRVIDDCATFDGKQFLRVATCVNCCLLLRRVETRA